jgi:hypothetical protein
MKALARLPSPAGARPASGRPVLQATAVTGDDVVGAVAAVDDFWSHAPGTGQRVWWVWLVGDLLAFAVILGFPLTAA